jgi:DNA-binding CsgD family transcriptional regulator
MAETLDRGRKAFGRRAWEEAFTHLSAADRESALEGEDLERLATAAYLLGRDADCPDLWARAHHRHLGQGNRERAARCAFWLAVGLLEKGESAQGSGWIARGRRLLGDGGLACVEQGYLLLPAALQCIDEGDNAAADATFGRAAGIGERFGDADLVALARHGQGRALIRLGRPAEGVALLDEAMIAVTAGEVSPIVVGDVYCGVISGCQEIFDWRRAQEWTAALARWCEAQPDLVAYRGQCLVRRAEILQLRGAWPDALGEARRACERLSRPPGQPGIGAAYYQQGELHRLRGDFAAAEEAYRRAGECGRKPQPGLSQLRLAQGQIAAAATAIRRVLDEAQDRRTRSRMLAAAVEVELAAGEIAAARAAAAELATIAAELGAPFLSAASDQAGGAVLLAEGDARAALAALGRAAAIWQELEVPYEGARARVLIGLACRALDDEAAAALELDAARSVFQGLGAEPDAARVEQLSRGRPSGAPGGLTAREVQVLRQVAAGRSNRAIAGELHISEKTVARHLSNIFVKLGLSSRAAATAYAYRHDLV